MVSALVKKLLWLSALLTIIYLLFGGIWNQYVTSILGPLGTFAGPVSLFAFLFVVLWVLAKTKVASLPS